MSRSLNRYVQLIRENRGMSKSEFAKIVEMNRTRIHSIEAGEHSITGDTVDHIAGKLGMTTDEFFEEALRLRKEQQS